MKILLISPKYPDTFWSFKHALKFISKKATHPPLGLITAAAMLPREWEKKLIDLNIKKLKDKHFEGVDYVFISAMSVQQDSTREVIRKCKQLGVKMVAGGPLFTTDYQDFPEVDHLILNEAEVTLPLFLEDLKNNTPKHLYTSTELPDIEKTPVPLWKLLKIKKYSSLSIQYSRGCPFACDFCNISTLYGRAIRAKNAQQILTELEAIYDAGWRDGVFFVDDNFIGSRKKVKEEILPTMIEWLKQKKFPFSFNTQASIDLSDDEELMKLMVDAGFNSVFIGIETPNEESLASCNKFQNKNRNLIDCVKKIQHFGLQVQGGFIVGFDSDPASIFDNLINFIQKSGVITAMVGLLNAPRGTALYQRLLKEKRLLKNFSGDNTDFSTNIIPKMNPKELLTGYKKIINSIYSPKNYYQRVKQFLNEYKPAYKKAVRLRWGYFKALIKSIFILGIKEKGRSFYWRLFFWSLFRKIKLFPLAMTLAIYGFHFRKIYKD